MLLTACSGHAERTRGARDALDERRPKQALALLNEELGVDQATQQPADVSGDQAILLLDRAMVLQHLGRYETSNADLNVADKRIDFLDLSHNAGDDLGKYLFSDDSGPYRAPSYEKLMIHTIKLLNYLTQQDLNGARVEARRLSVMQRFLKEHEQPGRDLTGPGSYLAGFAMEYSGKPGEALRYYDDALRYSDYRSLHPAIRRLAERSGYRSPRIRRVLKQFRSAAPAAEPDAPRPDASVAERNGMPQPETAASETAPNVAEAGTENEKATPATPPPSPPTDASTAKLPDADDAPRSDSGAGADESSAHSATARAEDQEPPSTAPPNTGELLVAINYGRVPAKYAKRIPIGLALTYAATRMSRYQTRRANALAAQGLVTWINFPALGKSRGAGGVPAVAINGDFYEMEGIVALDRETRATWKEAEGTVIASAITRMITRAAAGAVVGTAGKAATDSGIIGLLLSLGSQAALSAADTPDTRSWATLPARMAIARVRLASGTYRVQLSANGRVRNHNVTLKAGGFRVLTHTVLW